MIWLSEIAARLPASSSPSAANARASATPLSAGSADSESASATANDVAVRPSDPGRRTTRATTACSASGENGLPIVSTTLDALAKRSSRSAACPRAIITTTGTRASAGWSVSWRQKSAASRPGMRPSSRISSGTARASRIKARADSPSAAASTRCPASESARSTTFCTVGLSSMTSRYSPGMGLVSSSRERRRPDWRRDCKSDS